QERKTSGGRFWLFGRRNDGKVSGENDDRGSRQQSTAYNIAKENDSGTAACTTSVNVLRGGQNQISPSVLYDCHGNRFVVVRQGAIAEPLSVPRIRPRRQNTSLEHRRGTSEDYAYIHEGYVGRTARVSSNDSSGWSDAVYYGPETGPGDSRLRAYSTTVGPHWYFAGHFATTHMQLPGSFAPVQDRRVVSSPGTAGPTSHGYLYQPSLCGNYSCPQCSGSSRQSRRRVSAD
ncbi:hypothetical protein V1515DRAFT_607874, partial [Lipomyces mesembrius]